jgi:DNA-binding Lrp family transcriptional regulator
MDAIDYKLILEAEKGLALTSQPFHEIAAEIGITPTEVIARLQKLQESGVIRRFGVSIKPNSIGYSANALVAWRVPENRVAELGKYFSAQQEISHCYEREVMPGVWEYNFYTVMHARERKTIEEFVKQLSDATALKEYAILYSTRNLKTKSVKETKKC